MLPIDAVFDSVRDALRPSECPGRYIVAYSGGIDSHVLLHAMARHVGGDKRRLIAAHVDHGLHDDSREWARRCRLTAADLGIEMRLLEIDERPPRGASVEAWARRHRYRLLNSLMRSNDVLLTAHHRDDQVETLLLQLFRGSGPHGLSGIPEQQCFGPGLLVRPLIKVSRELIERYAKAFALAWIEDPSNAVEAHDRNYIRHQILPLVARRWPAACERIEHAAGLQQQAADCLDAAADTALDALRSEDGTRLPLATLAALDENLRRWVLRRWIVRARFPIPDAVHLNEMQRLLRARVDAAPCVSWKGVEMRRYRNFVYLMRARQRPVANREYAWDLVEPLSLPYGMLSAESSTGVGLRKALVAENGAVVRFRRGGERCHPLDRVHSQSLKRLFQEWGIAPWRRAELPLIFVGTELAAVADICVSRAFAADASEEGWTLTWRPLLDG